MESATAKPTTPCRTRLGFCPSIRGRSTAGAGLVDSEAIVLHHILAQVAADFELLEANLRQSFRILAETRPRADIAELDGVSIASLGASFQMFNAAFLNRHVPTPEDMEDRLNRARRLFLERGLPWAFWICEDWLARPVRRALVGVCEKFGMRAAA